MWEATNQSVARWTARVLLKYLWWYTGAGTGDRPCKHKAFVASPASLSFGHRELTKLTIDACRRHCSSLVLTTCSQVYGLPSSLFYICYIVLSRVRTLQNPFWSRAIVHRTEITFLFQVKTHCRQVLDSVVNLHWMRRLMWWDVWKLRREPV